DYYAVGRHDGRIEIYDKRTNQIKKILVNGHNAPVHQVRFNALGNQLVSVSRNETAIWSLDGTLASVRLEGSPLEPLDNAQFIPGHDDQILLQTSFAQQMRLYVIHTGSTRAFVHN
ncbi:MAG: hypothetical protein KDD39_14055, partial [Bdellovibrionales bacterium]|nr:hypothetical protein [Bdellovibrionales bacterium]